MHYPKGTLHPTNLPDPARLWRIKLQVLDLQARTYLVDKDKLWIPRLLSTLTEVNNLALSGLFMPSEALAAVKSACPAESATGVIWYEKLTHRLAAIFGSVQYVDIGKIEP